MNEIKKTPRLLDTIGEAKAGRIRIAESRAERRGCLFSLYEGVVCRVCHLYEQYGNLRNKATDEQNAGTDSEDGND